MQVVGRPAIDLAAGVREGRWTATEVVRAHLRHLDAVEPRLGAYVSVRHEAALHDAAAIDDQPADERGALAGVPVAIKDAIDVAGEATRHGSDATDDAEVASDDPAVARLRQAGAVVLGKTRQPELAIWGTSEDDDGIAVSPWDPTRSAGGSSGGSAAAVAAGTVPLALGSDGLGSVRIPAAACGVLGLRPGRGHLLATVHGEPLWAGMVRLGPLATTVADLALAMDVMTGGDITDDLGASPATGGAHVAVSWRSPLPGVTVARPWREAAIEAGRLLRYAGYTVERADPPVDPAAAQAVIARWAAGPAEHAAQLGLDASDLQPRTRGQIARSRRLSRARPVRDYDAERWRRNVEPFFDAHDVLVTPVLARAQPSAEAWHRRSWTANIGTNLATYPFTASWNLADLPALAIPLGEDGGRPLAVQLVAGPGREALLLGVAADLERLVPWQRHAPGWLEAADQH